jgi:lysylphosphatidylglycerol synthetase-like protein (DUF2156 family)
MNDSYKTKFGNFKIQDEKILISDNSRIQFLMIKIILSLNLITSLLFLLSHGIQFDFKSCFWAIICASSIILLLALFRFTHKKELHPDEIKSIKYIERFGNQILSLQLKNKKIRRIYLLGDKKNYQSLLINLKNSLNLKL